jgi:hypothetical protein
MRAFTYYRHTNDLNALLADPHYSCPVFSEHPQGLWIFGADTCKQGEYADRLYQWDRDKAYAAQEHAKAEGHKQNTAAYIQAWLSDYYGTPVALHGIKAGVQAFNGYPWYWYAFTKDGAQ